MRGDRSGSSRAGSTLEPMCTMIFGIVVDRREGRWSYYSVDPEALTEVHDLSNALQPSKLKILTRGPACCRPRRVIDGAGVPAECCKLPVASARHSSERRNPPELLRPKSSRAGVHGGYHAKFGMSPCEHHCLHSKIGVIREAA